MVLNIERGLNLAISSLRDLRANCDLQAATISCMSCHRTRPSLPLIAQYCHIGSWKFAVSSAAVAQPSLLPNIAPKHYVVPQNLFSRLSMLYLVQHLQNSALPIINCRACIEFHYQERPNRQNSRNYPTVSNQFVVVMD